jgi:hypothetical protein
MRPWLSVGLWFGLVVAVAACATRQPIPNQRSLDPSAAYIAAMKQATRQLEFTQDFNVHGTIAATLVNAKFQAAFEKEYGAVYGPTAADPKLVLPQLTLIFAIATNETKLNNLEALTKLWTLTYANGTTAEVAPIHIEKLDRDPLFMRYFFPYWTPWRSVYRLEFPLDVSTAGGTLNLRGVAGDYRLTW